MMASINIFFLFFKGSVLSFVSIREKPLMYAVEEHLSKGFNGQQVIQ